MDDHALDGRKRQAQRRRSIIVDVLVPLTEAHRRRGAAMEINDFAGISVAHHTIVDVVDRAVAGKGAQRRPLWSRRVRGLASVRAAVKDRAARLGVSTRHLAKVLGIVALRTRVVNLVGPAASPCRRRPQVDADVQPSREDRAHGTMVDGDAGIAARSPLMRSRTISLSRTTAPR